MTSFEKLLKFNERTKELYEQKFNKADWDAKKPEAKRWYNKCKKQAMSEIFETR
jgi:hypothetical protein